MIHESPSCSMSFHFEHSGNALQTSSIQSGGGGESQKMSAGHARTAGDRFITVITFIAFIGSWRIRWFLRRPPPATRHRLFSPGGSIETED
jgi:hypothetical protein